MDSKLIKFDSEDFDIIIVDGKAAMTAEAIGKKLGYSEPRRSIMNLFGNHRQEFDKDEDWSVIKLMTEAGLRETIVFFQTGAILICMFTEQPEGVRYRRIFKQILAMAPRALQAAASQSSSYQERYIALLEKHLAMLETQQARNERAYSPSPFDPLNPDLVRKYTEYVNHELANLPDPDIRGLSKADMMLLALKHAGISKTAFVKSLGISMATFDKWLKGKSSSAKMEAFYNNLMQATIKRQRDKNL